ncbi:hypothetical protein [Spirosoma foliorum]|uniref:Uncharacterized protein n=1 Tax=Spirosoma foliorum TaxID=2710596 RepID=A0A7G5H2Q2_9BACT|nr:hypothetical protein [Spirosoma foliorum]QMW05394.1 hypothetical protein H3H32_11125 [Spirosoma foliorum]
MEEQEEDKVDPDYLRGFNEGYMLTQHNPELAETLASIDSEFIRLAGFKAGREQFQTEQVQTQQKENFEPDRQEAQDAMFQTDVFAQLYRQQTQAKDIIQTTQPPTTGQQIPEETGDLFTQLKKKQEQGHKGLDIEP